MKRIRIVVNGEFYGYESWGFHREDQDSGLPITEGYDLRHGGEVRGIGN